MGEMRNANNILVRKPERKRPPARPKRRWENNIRMDVTETGLRYVDWLYEIWL
jgi:hypothetical protein